MSCFHPMHGFVIGKTDSGKDKYQIESGEVTWVHPLDRNGNRDISRFVREFIEIPCGKCIGCRLDYSKEWATRCMLEAKQYKHNAFITLTYDNENIKLNKGINRETGEIELVGNLVPNDLTNFMKKLRRHWEYNYGEKNIRFYACGEYGSNTFRPHYHIICFNIDIPDLKYFFTNKSGDKTYTSEIIEKIWGKGIVSIGEVTWNSAAYTARYVMKKIKGKNAKEQYEEMGILPEFVRMSRKPGIARNFYEDNKEKIYLTDEVIVTNKNGLAMKAKPSKYFDRLYDLDSPEAMEAIKKARKERAEIADIIRATKTSLSKEEYLLQKEEITNRKLKKLKRVGI
ncbi:MAG: hypothetical protein PUB18_00945 [bacterium]|nr:hypothetical protein [bacterium]